MHQHQRFVPYQRGKINQRQLGLTALACWPWSQESCCCVPPPPSALLRSATCAPSSSRIRTCSEAHIVQPPRTRPRSPLRIPGAGPGRGRHAAAMHMRPARWDGLLDVCVTLWTRYGRLLASTAASLGRPLRPSRGCCCDAAGQGRRIWKRRRRRDLCFRPRQSTQSPPSPMWVARPTPGQPPVAVGLLACRATPRTCSSKQSKGRQSYGVNFNIRGGRCRAAPAAAAGPVAGRLRGRTA